jgi:hypothetical protein
MDAVSIAAMAARSTGTAQRSTGNRKNDSQHTTATANKRDARTAARKRKSSATLSSPTAAVAARRQTDRNGDKYRVR